VLACLAGHVFGQASQGICRVWGGHDFLGCINQPFQDVWAHHAGHTLAAGIPDGVSQAGNVKGFGHDYFTHEMDQESPGLDV